MVDIFFKIIFAYFIGSIVGALFISRFFGGVDIREQGSGNAGATNALLTQGKLFGLLVLIIDFSKGVFACFFLPSFNLGFLGISASIDQDVILYLVGFFTIVGHIWPIWYGFRGGKGGATAAGVLFVSAPVIFAPIIAMWLFIILITGFVGLATVSAPIIAAIYLALENFSLANHLFILTLAISILIAYSHRSNISRMMSGEERKVSIIKKRNT